ncbi:MAG: penicillin-binding protein activator [Patescibacteria group bacterium]
MNTQTVVGVVVVLVAVVGGYLLFSRPALPEGPVKIGVIAPLTGDAASYGESLRDVMLLAAEEINAAGGIEGRQVQLVIEDGKCNGKDAASAAQKLVSVDSVEVVIGGFCSSESLAAEPVTTASKVALFSAASSNPGLTNVSPYFARNYPSDSSQGTFLADIASDRGYKKVAVIQEQTDYAAGVFGAFSTELTAKGGVVVKEEFPSKHTDFRSLIAKLKAEKPDALFIIAQTQAAEKLLFAQLQQQAWNTPLLINDVIAGDKEMLAEYAPFLEGALTAEFTVDPTNTKYQKFLAAFVAKYSKEPTLLAYAQTEYDAVYLVADAIREVGYDGTKIAAWLRTVKDWDGAVGKVTIGANGDPVAGHRPEVIRGGVAAPYSR